MFWIANLTLLKEEAGIIRVGQEFKEFPTCREAEGAVADDGELHLHLCDRAGELRIGSHLSWIGLLPF